MVSPPILLLEGMTTAGVEKDGTEMDIIMLSCNNDAQFDGSSPLLDMLVAMKRQEVIGPDDTPNTLALARK
jgi:hypothetical protein